MPKQFQVSEKVWWVDSEVWEVLAATDAACGRVRSHWNMLMKPPPVTKPEPTKTEPGAPVTEYDEFDIVNDWGDPNRVWKTEEERNV